MTVRWVHIALIIFIAAILYASTMPTSITLEDAGLFQMVCHLGGISHPPGYPLFTLLCNQMTVGTSVIAGNLISVVFALLAVVLFYEVVNLITANEMAALFAAIAYALSSTFWSQAIIIEVYSLAACLFMLCWWLLIKFSQTEDVRYWYCLCLAAGLGISNHWPLFVLSSLGFLSVLFHCRLHLWALMNRAGFWIGSILLFVVGLLPYISILANSTPEIALVGAIGTDEFFNYVSRSYYSDHQEGFGPGDKRLFYAWLLSESGLQLGIVAIPVVMAGFYRSITELHRHQVISLIVIFLATTFLLMFLVDFKFEIRAQAVFSAYTLIAYSAVAVWFSLGLVWLLEQVPRQYKTSRVLLAMAFLLSVAIYNYPKADRSKLDFVEQYAQVVLESLPADAILFLKGDTQVGPFGFLNKVKGVRPDVTIYSWHSLIFANRLSDPLNPKATMEKTARHFIKNSSRPVFSIDGRQDVDTNYGLYYSYNNIGGAPFVFIPALERFIDYVLELYANDMIVNLHEKQFAYDLLVMATRQYVDYGFNYGTDSFEPAQLDRIQRLQNTFPGKLATLEIIFLSEVEIDKTLMLSLATEAERQITDQLPVQGLSEFYQHFGKIHQLVPEDIAAATRSFEESVKILPVSRNKSVCLLRSNYLQTGEFEKFDALERKFSPACRQR